MLATRTFVFAVIAWALVACGEGHPPALMADTEAPTIRVLLGKPRPSARIRVRDGAWTLTGQGIARTGDSRLALIVQASASGITIRQSSASPQVLDATLLRLQARKGYELDGRTYFGTLIVRKTGKALELVGELDLETYVAGVVANEVGPGAKVATHRAQAVAARTYAYRRLMESSASGKPYHVFDDQRSQVYSGREVPEWSGVTYEQMVRATRSSRGVIMAYGGRPIRAYYSSTCGGHTTDAATSDLDPGHAAVPLRGVPCPHCRPSKLYNSKYFSWTKDVTEKEIAAKLAARKQGITLPIHALRIKKAGRGGWAAKVEIVYGPSKRSKVISGSTFRTVAGLRSHHIKTMEGRGSGSWRITGRGWGHGVGMCQVGAIQMGHKGASATEILRYYYPGISFQRLY